MGGAPTGTVTFLFTDVVGSTAAWESHPQQMAEALLLHDEIVRTTIDAHGGHVFATGGDGFAVAFQRADDAVAAAVAAQRSLRSASWPDGRPLTVRMGAHTGDTVEREGDYFGPTVNRAARVMDSANGGQFVITSLTDSLVPSHDPGVATRSLGAHRFKGLDGAIEVVEVVIDGVDDLGSLRRGGGGSTHGLPDHRTSFVGRGRESEQLRAAIADHRLVTVVAPGGSGKTRLVSEVARDLAGDCPDGVWFVDLTEIRDDDAVPATVAADLDLGGALVEGDPLDALARWQAIVILDNCEQVVDGVAELVDDLMSACPDLTLVATSREALAVDGERVVPLGPLGGSEGTEADEAVGLFLARARLVAPDFRPTAEEIAEIAGLCEALDRLPLAIELAAARADRMAVGQIVDGLLSGRRDRRARRRQGRHSDLRSVLAWSTDLLDDVERTVWRRLAVFEGGFTADAVVEVAALPGVPPATVNDVLDGLVDRSLVVRRRTGSGMRHHLLETVRAVAVDELGAAGESDATLERHARWIERWSAAARAEPAVGWLDDPTEIDNQRRALRFLIAEDETHRAVHLLADAITPIVYSGHLAEVDGFAEELRAAVTDDPIVTARLGEIDMIRAEWRGDFVDSHLAGEALRAADVDDRSWAIGTVMVAHHFAAIDPPEARRMIDASVERMGEDRRSILLRAEASVGDGRFDEAIAHQMRAWGVDSVDQVASRVSGPAVDVTMLADLAVSLLLIGRSDEVDSVIAAMENAESISTVRHYPAVFRSAVVAQAGDAGGALDHLADAVASERRSSSPFLATDLCVAAAYVALHADEHEIAHRALSTVEHLGQRTVGAFAWRRWIGDRLRPLAEAGRSTSPDDLGDTPTPRETVDECLRRLRAARVGM